MTFSRHAKNNMRLYGVTIADVELTIAAPLKVIYVIEREPVIVTVYPVRKSYRR